MPGLDSIIGLSSTAEQLFVWGVLQQVIVNLIQPYLQAEQDKVWSENPLLPLSPAQLAGLVVRGHMTEADAAGEAAKSGIDSSRFHLMVEQYGNPPGPQTLAEALRRGFIPEGQPGDGSPSYEGGIAQGDLQNKWSGILKQLDLRLPGPTVAVTAAVRGMVSDSEARALFALFGGDPSQYDLEYNVAGEGPSPVEAGVLANRGIIPWDGTGPNVTSFAQAVNESRFKNKWVDAYKALAIYRPPPRTVTAMLREGSITESQAITYLQQYGVPADAIPAYTSKSHKSAVQTAHEITESNIITLYKERAITKEEATAHLVTLGYSQDDAALILTSAELQYQITLTNATMAAIRSAYLHHHITRGDAITQLDARGVNSQYRDSQIALWDLEIEVGLKQLTPKQILDFWSVNLIDKDTATLMLTQAGYSDRDAGLLVAFNDPNAPWLTGPASNASSTG